MPFILFGDRKYRDLVKCVFAVHGNAFYERRVFVGNRLPLLMRILMRMYLTPTGRGCEKCTAQRTYPSSYAARHVERQRVQCHGAPHPNAINKFVVDVGYRRSA